MGTHGPENTPGMFAWMDRVEAWIADKLDRAEASATYGRAKGRVVDVVKDYGAVVDGTTDDTAAWQSAIDAVGAAGGGTVTCSLQGVSIIGGALQDTSGANAQLLLPSVHALNSKQVSITIATSTPPPPVMSVVGDTPVPDTHLVLKSTLNAGVGGALLGGRGPTGSFENFTFLFLQLRNITFRLPSNPVLSALNLSLVTAVDLDNVIVDCGSYYVQGLTEPTTATSYGVRLPANNNGAYTRLGAVNVVGFYNAYEIGEHTVGQQVAAWGCKISAVVPFAFHASKFTRFMSVHCQRGIVFTGTHYLDIDQFNIEHAASGWWAPVYDIDDASNHGHGTIRWHVVLSGVGFDSTFLTNGAANLRVTRTGNEAPSPSFARVQVNTDSTTLTAGVMTPVIFDTESVDTDNYHSTIANQSRITIPRTGYYRIEGCVVFAEVAGGFRFIKLWKNGITGVALAQDERAPVVGESTICWVSTGVIALVAGDYVEMAAYQSNAGGAYAGSGDGVGNNTWLSIERVS